MVRAREPLLCLALAVSLALIGCTSTVSQTSPGTSSQSISGHTHAGNGEQVAMVSTPGNARIAHPDGTLNGVTGVWEGTTVARCLPGMPDPGRCNAWQDITLTMFQNGDRVTGYYKCAYGSQVCRNLDERGIIRNGTMRSGRLMMRVMLGDGSMCFFTGIPHENELSGGYSCLQGGGLLEEGRFHTQRSY